MAEFDPIPCAAAANDDVVAHLVIGSDSGVTFQYTDALDTIAGRAWLRRRLEVAIENLGSAAARQTQEPSVLEV